jgi:uncharacterized surface protein with fasciclin (FAS1) repeats
MVGPKKQSAVGNKQVIPHAIERIPFSCSMKIFVSFLILCFLPWNAGAFMTRKLGTTQVVTLGLDIANSQSSTSSFIVRLDETSGNAPSDGTADTQSAVDLEETSKLNAFLEKKYPRFYQKLVNEEMLKAIKKGSITVFVPNNQAFEELGEKKMKQIEDPRNEEIREKMGSYHIVPEPISAIELRTEDWTKGRPKDGSKPSKSSSFQI